LHPGPARDVVIVTIEEFFPRARGCLFGKTRFDRPMWLMPAFGRKAGVEDAVSDFR